ncbi:hypothetical protein Lser_V15G15834 [Lactuca serriola]
MTGFGWRKVWSELGDMGADMGSPHWVQFWLFTVNDICGIEKSAMIGSKVLSQATPNMMSAPSTGRINNGTRKLDEEKRKVDVGALDKFIHRQPVEEHIKEHVEEYIEEHVEEHIEKHVEEHIEEQEHVEVEETEEHEPIKDLVDIYDPRRWVKLNSDEIKILVEKGPKRDSSIMYGPYDKFVFRKGISKGKLDGEGYADWHHVTTRVKEHEISLDHFTNRNKWFDMRKRLNLNETIDKDQHE